MNKITFKILIEIKIKINEKREIIIKIRRSLILILRKVRKIICLNCLKMLQNLIKKVKNYDYKSFVF